MISINVIKNEIPVPIRLFLGKALLFFIAWKIIYSGFLFDSRLLDYPLTTHVAEASTKFLNSLGFLNDFSTERLISRSVFQGDIIESEVSQIYHEDYIVLNIENSCNGLELIVLYIGFIICMPSSFTRKLRYVFLGILLLDFINILRCTGLIYLREYFEVYFDFAHHYLFKVIIYGATFVIWRFYARKIHFKNESIQIG